jgi:hypothetical protein
VERSLIFELAAECTINLIWQLPVIANTITDSVCPSRCCCFKMWDFVWNLCCHALNLGIDNNLLR